MSERPISVGDEAWCILPGSTHILHFNEQGGSLVSERGEQFHVASFFEDDSGDTKVINEQEHQQCVSKAVQWMQAGHASKVVLSRVKLVELDRAIEGERVLSMMQALRAKYPHTFVYALRSARFGFWIGATPETLVSAQNNAYQTMALAGTRQIGRFDAWGEKEKREQAMVTEDILDRLKGMGAVAVKASEPRTVQAGRIEHLRSDIAFIYNGEWKDVVATLHPTPAVGGFPREAALNFIREHEKHKRGLYAGYLGIVDENGVSIYVNLRCMRIENKQAFLFVGGGITAQSDPAAEWQETEWKSRTLLDVLIEQGFVEADPD